MAGKIGTQKRSTARATGRPRLRDLEWAAGFLEGEGGFYKTPTSHLASATQKETREPLERLHRLFGGGIARPRPNGVMCWQAYGSRARGIAMTLYALLSARRKAQIRRMLEA